MDSPAYRTRLREEGELMEGTGRDRWFWGETHHCVFLEGGRCSVYPIRPTVCRSYFVISPAHLCQHENRNAPVGSIDLTDLFVQMFQRHRLVHTKYLGLKDTNMRMLMGSIPRMVALALEVYDRDDYADIIRQQIWPTLDTIEGWRDGINPFGEKLYQIKKTKEG